CHTRFREVSPVRKRLFGFVSLGAASSLFLAACGGGGASGDTADTEDFNRGENEVADASDSTGGTLRYALAAELDSTVSANTYYACFWNFSRYYARTLLAFNPEPGESATDLVTDMAADFPEPSDDFTEWTVEIPAGLKDEDGSEITAEDSKYGVARANVHGGVCCERLH